MEIEKNYLEKLFLQLFFFLCLFSLPGANHAHVTWWAVSMVRATQTRVYVLVSCW